jgi:hypothetical protein
MSRHHRLLSHTTAHACTIQQANSVELVKLLLAAGASTTSTADLYDGDAPLQLAQRLKFADVAALF